MTLVDNSQQSLDKGVAFAEKLLKKDVDKQKLSQSDADAVRGRLTASTNMDDLGDVDMVIEAVPEIVSLKTKIFAQLAATCPPHAILATNTSSISITRIAASTTKVSAAPVTVRASLSDRLADCPIRAAATWAAAALPASRTRRTLRTARCAHCTLRPAALTNSAGSNTNSPPSDRTRLTSVPLPASSAPTS